MTNDNDSVRADGGFDRRGLIKRAAVVGVATAWATPTIQSLAAPAFAAGTTKGGCTACLTGGGEILPTAATPVIFRGANARSLTFGLGPLCCGGGMPTEIQVTAHPAAGPGKGKGNGNGNSADVSFHFDRQLSMICVVTGNPAPPPATEGCANRFTGTAMDADGNKLTFIFEDNGEGKSPSNTDGGDVDFVSIIITGPNGQQVLSGSGSLAKGNLQAHDHLGKIRVDCSGC